MRAFCAGVLYGFPGKKMIVIGVTGTKGKTSTANYIWSVLRAGGYKAGLISTANFRIGNKEELNAWHMTMPGSFFIQKTLKRMLTLGVSIAVVEMTSEGMQQYRHAGIPVDIAVFTNLTPEHLKSHGGSFEKYKKAKSPLFKALSRKKKLLNGKKVSTLIIANTDSEHAPYYLSFPADKKMTYGNTQGDFLIQNTVSTKEGTTFSLGDGEYRLSIPGSFNVYNAVPAILVGHHLGIDEEKITEGLLSLKNIPGRMDLIDEGQDFTVVVDYAHEPAGLTVLLESAQSIKAPTGKIILLSGVIGGGRESRVPMARIGAQKADYFILTTEDPYEEDPKKLIDELARTAENEGKKPGTNLFPIEDRREAITKALSLASSGDIVLIAGKGAETTMMVGAGSIPWNEREIVRELLQERLKQ